MTSSQGSPASPEKMFIAMLALLSCQVSASPIPAKDWAYLPDASIFQVVFWNNEPIRVNTDQPQLLGGSYTSYIRDKYPINFTYTFRGLTGDFPVCFNFPSNPKSFITPTKEGCIGASTKNKYNRFLKNRFPVFTSLGSLGISGPLARDP